MEIKGSGIRPPKKGNPGYIQRFLVYELQKKGLLIKHRFLWKNRRSFCKPSFSKRGKQGNRHKNNAKDQ